MSCLSQWVDLVRSCCGEEQPVEVKLMATKVLVNCTDTLLSSPHFPLGKSQRWNISASSVYSQPVKVQFKSKDFKLDRGSPIFCSYINIITCVCQVCPLLCLCGGVCSCCCRMKTRKSVILPLTSSLTYQQLCSEKVHSLPRWGMSAHTRSTLCIHLPLQSNC